MKFMQVTLKGGESCKVQMALDWTCDWIKSQKDAPRGLFTEDRGDIRGESIGGRKYVLIMCTHHDILHLDNYIQMNVA